MPPKVNFDKIFQFSNNYIIKFGCTTNCITIEQRTITILMAVKMKTCVHVCEF